MEFNGGLYCEIALTHFIQTEFDGLDVETDSVDSKINLVSHFTKLILGIDLNLSA